MKKRLVYWILEKVLPIHESRAKLLNNKGFEVHFFTLLESLLAQVEAKRTGIIMIGDFESEKALEKIILKLANMPETQAARLVLTLERRYPKIMYLAASTTFRDVIPMNIDDEQWFQRIMFATAARPVDFSQPTGQITMNSISTISLPARIVWLSKKRIRLECRLKPPIGSIINLEGSLPDFFGMKNIPIKVESTARNNLIYRFSDALTGSWALSPLYLAKVDSILNKLRINDVGPRCRVFLVVQSAKFRNAILQKLDHPRIELNAALQKQSITSEPIFFTPDIVFIEDTLCFENKGLTFQQMLKTLREDVPIDVMGDSQSAATLKSTYFYRQFISLPQIPSDLPEKVLTTFLPSTWHTHRAEEGSVNILSENPYSFASIRFPARITKIHPLAMEMTFPYPVGNFALCQVESPIIRKILNKNPFVKFTKVYLNSKTADPFIFSGESYLVDTDKDERKALATSLMNMINEYMQRYLPDQIPISYDKPTRTIEKTESVKKTISKEEKQSQIEIDSAPPQYAPTFFEEISNKIPATKARVNDATDSFAQSVLDIFRSDTIKHLAIWIGISALAAILIWIIAVVIEPRYEKSGKVYSDQFQKFSPDYFKKKAEEKAVSPEESSKSDTGNKSDVIPQ